MRTLVVGGAASGKSEFAEGLCLRAAAPRVYLATMEPIGDASAQRIERHRALREGKGFATVERARDVGALAGALPGGCSLLVEDVGNLVANELFSGKGAPAAESPEALGRLAEMVSRDLEALSAAAAHTVFVSVDVFSDGVGYDSQTAAYLRVLAQVNARLAQACERAVEVVCGIPVWMKGEGA